MKYKNKHPLWRRWTQIKFMITNENHKQHKYYENLPMTGFDDFWEFAEFVEQEIGAMPGPGAMLARKNQRAGYVKGNLYWAETHVEIGQRFAKIQKFKVGRKMMTLRQMAEESGLEESTIRSRLSRGWSAKDAMMIPAQLGQKIYAVQR